MSTPATTPDATTQAAHLTRELARIVVVGHVDHGKSTFVGRLFHDTGSLPEGKFEAIKATSEKRGMPFEWAFLMDALQAERDQGITIDTAQIWFKTKKRDYVIIDAPGHKEFLKNMISGAASADAALLLIDAAEGVREQSRRHGYLLHLLGVRQIAVLVNKMDLIGNDQGKYDEIVATYRDYLASIGVVATHFIPIAARGGDNLVNRSGDMPWYTGPTVVEALDDFKPSAPSAAHALRVPIQDVYKFDERRILVGRVEAGHFKVGDRLIFSPSNKSARVQSIETWSAPGLTEAEAGRSVGFTLDEQIFVERGEMASHEADAPIETDVFRARLFWLGRQPLEIGREVKLKLGTLDVPVRVQSIEAVIDTGDLSRRTVARVERNDVAEVVLRTKRLVALDSFTSNPQTGRFVIVDDYDIAGGGIISMEGYPDQRQSVTRRATNLVHAEYEIDRAARARRNGHHGAVLWFTGLSGAGKSTLANELEKRLFARGFHVYVLDGDNVRNGLNADLGFSPEDRAENIRRVSEVAALFAASGTVCITAFISPYRADRARAREAAGEDFHEFYIKADLETCEKRDPKGLYAKARAGQIPQFTGISAPYEAPDGAELVVDTSLSGIEACVDQLVAYVIENLALTKVGA